MSPVLLLALLVAGLLALMPVWQLRAARWPAGWLQAAWLVFVGLTLVALLAPSVSRVLVPILLVLFVMPSAIGTERLARLAGRYRPVPPRRIIDVTPRPGDERDVDRSTGGGAPPA